MFRPSFLRRRSRSHGPSGRIPAPVVAGLARGRQRVDALTEQLSSDALAGIRDLQREAAPYLERAQREAAPYLERAQREAAPYLGRAQREAALYLERAQREAAPYLERAQREAAPLIERATGKPQRKSRAKSKGLFVLLLLGLAAGVCYLLWQRRDKQPAYLVDEPERPSITPAGSPDPVAPAPAPGAPAVSSDDEAAALRLARSMVDREFAGTSSPTAFRETREVTREWRTREGAPSFPTSLGGTPWAPRPQMPGGSGPALPR